MDNEDYTIDGIEWRDIPGYESLYQVSNTGLVRRILKHDYKIMKPRNRYGYFGIGLYRGGKRYSYQVHRLVMLAFVGVCPDRMQVNHIDGVKKNNALSNLEYVTPSQNTLHAINVLKTFIVRKGSQIGTAKLTENDVLEIRKRTKSGERRGSLATEFGVNIKTIDKIVNRKRWKHIG